MHNLYSSTNERSGNSNFIQLSPGCHAWFPGSRKQPGMGHPLSVAPFHGMYSSQTWGVRFNISATLIVENQPETMLDPPD